MNLPDETFLGRSEIPVHETFAIHDSSKIQTFMGCPRAYFYTYVLGLRNETPNNHLVFGSAWHAAMEHLLLHGYSPESVQQAFQKFVEIYSLGFDGMMSPDDTYGKNPSNALTALATYAATFRDRPEDTLYTEIAGTIPISDERLIHYKMDTIRRHEPWHEAAGMIHSLEHKTTGRLSQAWRDKWSYIFQVGAYTHALICLFDEDEVDAVVINGAVFRKNDAEFLRIPVQKSKDMMQMWLWEANHWMDQIEWNFERLAESSPSDRVMVAFPRNTDSCSKFGCRFPHMCSLHANPLQHTDRVPIGYCTEFWDPRRLEKEAKHVAHLEKSNEILVNPNPQPKTSVDLL